MHVQLLMISQQVHKESQQVPGIKIGILGQVWYLIVSIPDLCTFTYFESYILATFPNTLTFSGGYHAKTV